MIRAINPIEFNIALHCSENEITNFLWSEISTKKNRLHSKKYSEAIPQLTANLELARKTNRPILLKRDNANHPLNELVDILRDNHLITLTIGTRSNLAKCASYFHPVPDFQTQLERACIRIKINDKHLFLELRDEKGGVIPLSKTSLTSALNAPVLAYNKRWLCHTITLHEHEYPPFCKRIFNESLDLGGRYYGTPIQQLSKTDRAQLLIDGCETVELDYSSLHPRILYSKIGVDYRDDPYHTSQFSRDLMKLSLLVLINSRTVASFKRMISLSSNPLNIQAWHAHKKRHKAYEYALSMGKPAHKPEMPKSLKGFIEGFEDYKGEQVQGKAVYDALCERHHLIKHFFCRAGDNLGLKLQCLDSLIMSRIIALTEQSNLALIPIHDSVICKISDAVKLYEIMIQAYGDVIGKPAQQIGDLPTVKSSKSRVLNQC